VEQGGERRNLTVCEATEPGELAGNGADQGLCFKKSEPARTRLSLLLMPVDGGGGAGAANVMVTPGFNTCTTNIPTVVARMASWSVGVVDEATLETQVDLEAQEERGGAGAPLHSIAYQ
jgi:hypothetical protein